MSLMICLILLARVTLDPVLTLESPPEARDLFLGNVLHIEIDGKGQFYASDFPSSMIYVWNPDGTFKETFGHKGEGPGEFSFAAALGPPMGYVYTLKDAIYVYDGGSRTLSILNRDFSFRKRINFEGLGGKINGFQVLEEGRFLFYDSYFCQEKACRRVMVYNEAGKLLETWMQADDNTWSRGEKQGVTNLYIWSPIPVTDYSDLFGEAILANSSRPTLEVRDRSGKILRTLDLNIPKKQVTREDIDEYNAQEWVKDNDSVKIFFPEEKDYFDRVLTLKDGYLVFHLSPLYAIADGYLVSRKGQVLDHFHFKCGQGGGLFAPRGRLMGAIVDEVGDFKLQELVIRQDK